MTVIKCNENNKRFIMKEKNKKSLWIKILIIAGAIVMVGIIATVSWVEAYWYNIDEFGFNNRSNVPEERFIVEFEAGYWEKFNSGEMTIEDFGWENIDRIDYDVIPYPITTKFGIVYLKKTGERRVKKAILHCRKLEFVKYAEIYSEMMLF